MSLPYVKSTLDTFLFNLEWLPTYSLTHSPISQAPGADMSFMQSGGSAKKGSRSLRKSHSGMGLAEGIQLLRAASRSGEFLLVQMICVLQYYIYIYTCDARKYVNGF